jgi:hypothetical protein
MAASVRRILDILSIHLPDKEILSNMHSLALLGMFVASQQNIFTKERQAAPTLRFPLSHLVDSQWH